MSIIPNLESETYSNSIADSLSKAYSIDAVIELQNLLTRELTQSIDQKIIQDLLNPQNIRKAKIDIIKERLKSSE